MAGTTGAFYWSERDRLNAQFQEQRLNVIKRLVIVSHDDILANDHLPLIRYLSELKKSSPEVVWAGVLHAGEYVAHTETRWLGKTPADEFSLKAISATDTLELRYSLEGNDILEAAAPIKAGDSKIGTARIGFSQETVARQFNETLRKTTARILQVAIIALVLGITAAVLLARTMTQRISQLVKGARSLATGNFSEKLELKGSDEIHELASEFNTMAAQLNKLYSHVQEQANLLSKANLELLKLDAIKKNFFSLVSHELRGPLSTIKGYVSMLLSSQGLEEWSRQERQIKIIREETDRIAKMINEFMDLSRIEAGTFQIEKRAVDPRVLVSFVSDRMEPEAENNGVRFTWEVVEPVPEFSGDPERISQVLINLVTNSLKFTPNGGAIHLEVRQISRGRRADDTDQVQFQIKDTGKGILPELLDKVFERYYQVEGEHKKKGLGLGLAFAKEVIERHEGKIWASSDGLNKGAIFTFTIPVG